MNMLEHIVIWQFHFLQCLMLQSFRNGFSCWGISGLLQRELLWLRNFPSSRRIKWSFHLRSFLLCYSVIFPVGFFYLCLSECSEVQLCLLQISWAAMAKCVQFFGVLSLSLLCRASDDSNSFFLLLASSFHMATWILWGLSHILVFHLCISVGVVEMLDCLWIVFK